MVRENSRRENPARKDDEKLAAFLVVVKANALGQFANQGAKRHECNQEKLLGISDDDDTTGTRKVKTAPSALLMLSPPKATCYSKLL